MISVEYKTDLGPVGAKDQGNLLLFKHNLLKENNKSSITWQIKEENLGVFTTIASVQDAFELHLDLIILSQKKWWSL